MTLSDPASASLLDLIPAISPNFKPPWHLHQWCELLERAAQGGPVRGLCAEPIRHYKTETTCHGVVMMLLRDPSTPVIYLSHSHERAVALGKKIRSLADAADRQFGTTIGPERGQNTIADWSNSHGGGVVVMSAEQSKLGYNCGCLIADDPLDERGAVDPKVRDAVDDTISHYTARCMRRGVAGPVMIVASRWHPDDPMGRRLSRHARQWEYFSHRAIDTRCDRCERSVAPDSTFCATCGGPTRDVAFAPDVWGLDELHAMRAELREKDPTERIWWAQLQNEPRPAGADLFREATHYTKLPDWNYRKGYGIDLAYTVGEGADWFARVAGRVYGNKLYLLDVVRHKIDAHLIESTCKADMLKWGRAGFFSYMSGPEIGMARVLQERGVPIQAMVARYNKLVRAQRTVKRWNDGDILVPEETAASWVKGFIHRLGCFRGHEYDRDDDEVDALVSLCDGILGGVAAGGGPKVMGRAYSGL